MTSHFFQRLLAVSIRFSQVISSFETAFGKTEHEITNHITRASFYVIIVNVVGFD